MKRLRQTVIMIIMLMMFSCVITGCGKVKASPSDIDTVSIIKDGRIVQTIADQFDQSYYSVDELSEMTQEKIALYSDEEQDIVCETVEENDGVVTVSIAYKTYSDYMEFNGTEAFFGTVEEAAQAGYSVKDMVSNDGAGLTDEELLQIGNNHVFIIQTEAGEELGINVYDKILYVSDGVVLSGKKEAIIEAKEENRCSCIVFK